MNKSDLLRAYDQQLRGETEIQDADELRRIGPLWAATFPSRGRGFVTYERIPADIDLPSLVGEVIDHFHADPRVDHFEWKTRGHDALPHLLELLQNLGLEVGPPETVMAGDADSVIAAGPAVPARYRVERAEAEQAVREAEALAGRVFGDTEEHSRGLADQLVEQLRRDPRSFEMWLVRDENSDVVCSGRVDFVPGTDFAGLWGGACAESHWGKGLYRALTAERARAAKARGAAYLYSDCTEFSRPILSRAGLTPITTTTPAVWHRKDLKE